MSDLMLEALDARAILDEKDRTQIIREAIAGYLDLSDEPVEDKLEALEEKQHSLGKAVDSLCRELKGESKRTDSLETRIEELNRVMALFLERVN
ncbi:MAG: ribbon-helix-helix protein, CopG family [Roseofilum sp. Belize BBD 4]|uniref:hypothetical protein n=1 Tax=Roseofilum sp. Belize BBD 4 TaxID=2821500 RepID=UPI001B142F89|nr:hypothetical protein [Roseofilum sp. Belize BBD 4]MBP0035119.1 ribbon-helix-helix protein, CopG family [Roseofilum sp. Belize BBD 4]